MRETSEKKSTIQLFDSKLPLTHLELILIKWKSNQDMTPAYFSIEFKKNNYYLQLNFDFLSSNIQNWH